MTRNIYFIIGLVLVLVVAGFVFIKQRGGEVLAPTGEEVSLPQESAPVAPTSSAPSAAKLEVVYTASGFSPKTLIVKTGDTVLFKNNSGRDFWPASAVHPTHTLYPEFDAKRAISSGGSYSFTFTRTGSWKYHDHLNPGATGTITVQ
ncbi:MAG: hypothetical protein WD889_00930 [Candidatus Colwellbacteria bacterium]